MDFLRKVLPSLSNSYQNIMKGNLSSQIKLDRTPKQYYRPTNAYEYTLLTRFEKVFTEIFESSEIASVEVGKEIAKLIRSANQKGLSFVMALRSGTGTTGVYAELIRQ